MPVFTAPRNNWSTIRGFAQRFLHSERTSPCREPARRQSADERSSGTHTPRMSQTQYAPRFRARVSRHRSNSRRFDRHAHTTMRFSINARWSPQRRRSRRHRRTAQHKHTSCSKFHRATVRRQCARPTLDIFASAIDSLVDLSIDDDGSTKSSCCCRDSSDRTAQSDPTPNQASADVAAGPPQPFVTHCQVSGISISVSESCTTHSDDAASHTTRALETREHGRCNSKDLLGRHSLAVLRGHPGDTGINCTKRDTIFHSERDDEEACVSMRCRNSSVDEISTSPESRQQGVEINRDHGCDQLSRVKDLIAMFETVAMWLQERQKFDAPLIIEKDDA